jgi:hypothetical protein
MLGYIVTPCLQKQKKNKRAKMMVIASSGTDTYTSLGKAITAVLVWRTPAWQSVLLSFAV